VEYPNQFLRKIIELAPAVKHMTLFVEIVMYPKRQYYRQLLDIIGEMESRNILFGAVLVRPNQFWDGVYDADFWEIFDKWVNDDRHSHAIPIRHVTTDGVKYVNETYLLKNRLNYNGYRCQQMAYNVTMSGDFTNVCTGTRLPINAQEPDFKQIVTCPNTLPCDCYPMLVYKKKNPRYVDPTSSN
jgi:hypothetical protein